MYGINLEQKQTHNLTQAYIQSLEILALSNDELHTLLENEYLENPIFEYTEHIANKSNRMIVENYGIDVYKRQTFGHAVDSSAIITAP